MNEGIAIRYAQLGYAVFPLAANSKIPAISKERGGRGCHDATTDIDQIETWWRDYPKANVGIATGPVSNCWVLDIDPETSPEGAAWLAEKEAEHGPLPVTPEAKTLKGGRHVLFKWNPDYPVGNRVNFGDARGLDARGDGGYIVAAPSTVTERKAGKTWTGKYAWTRKPSETPLADAPLWLLEAVVHKKQTQTAETFVPRERREGDGFKYGNAALDVECQNIRTAPPGGQDNQIVSSAFKIGQLVEGGEIPRQDAEDALVNAAMAIPAQSKSLSEIIDKVKRAMSAGGEKPRRAPAKPERTRPALKAVGGSEKPKTRERIDPETGEVFEDEPAENVEQANWAMGLNWSLTDEGKLKPQSLNNARLMLTHHPKFAGRLALNTFSHQVWITDSLPCDHGEPAPRVIQDHDYIAVAAWLNTVGLAPGWQTVGQVIGLISSRNTFDPVREYLEKLTWDGKPRIDHWLSYYAGAVGTDYTRTVGPRFLISAVARVFDPGCKVDTMLVLEGPQGLKKSTLARALFGSDWFSDQVGDVTSKESAIQIQGLWCIEVAEMDQFSRADDKAVKSFLSRQDDRYRPTYGLNTIDRKRRCVFIGTINPEGSGWIKDATGGRRYWPVEVVKVDIEAVMHDRDQIWAESVVRYRSGDKWWLEPEEERAAKREQAARQEQDLWDETVREWLSAKMPGARFRLDEVVSDALKIGVEKRDRQVQVRTAKILTRLGCISARWYDDNGKQTRGWEKPMPQNEE